MTAATVVGVPSVAGDEHDDAIAHWDVPEGTDVGPGNYTYPTTGEIDDGAFDLAGLTITSEDGEYHFTHEFHNELSNPWGGDYGYSHQHLQIYLHNPDADGGTIEAREGVNATFEAPYHHRIVVSPFSGEPGSIVEDAEGSTVDEDVEVNTEDGNKITVSVDESTIDYVEEGAVAALSLSHDGGDDPPPGFIRPVAEDGGEWEFGGAENDYAPQVIDLATEEDVSNEDALAYSDGEYAEIPLLQVGDEEVDDDHDEEVDDPNGDDEEDHDDEDDHDEEDDHDDDDDANGEDDHDDDDEADDDGSPGFGIGAAIAGAAGGALVKKRLSDDEVEE